MHERRQYNGGRGTDIIANRRLATMWDE